LKNESTVGKTSYGTVSEKADLKWKVTPANRKLAITEMLLKWPVRPRVEWGFSTKQ